VEARALGWSGVTRVAEATGLARATIQAGISELRGEETTNPLEPLRERQRCRGGGRKQLEDKEPAL
jgi:hypothetical protein